MWKKSKDSGQRILNYNIFVYLHQKYNNEQHRPQTESLLQDQAER